MCIRLVRLCAWCIHQAHLCILFYQQVWPIYQAHLCVLLEFGLLISRLRVFFVLDDQHGIFISTVQFFVMKFTGGFGMGESPGDL